MNSRDLLIEVLKDMVGTMRKNKELLTELDTAIGDCDHGINMEKGFIAIDKKLDDFIDKDCSTILKMVSMTLITTVGGASGPLYGTAFMKAASIVNGKIDIEKEDAVEMLAEAIKGIKIRGKAVQGEKTMLDTLIPAYEALKDGINQGDSLFDAFQKSEKAAMEGMEFTKKIKATKGRASYLGERSIGHQDPGATSSYLIIKSIADTLKKHIK